jgi:hypothetical protein
MIGRHIDVVALLVIVLGLLAFSWAPRLPFVPEANAAAFGFMTRSAALALVLLRTH